jgi:hypothetical protein
LPWQLPAERQHQADGQLGHGDCVRAGGVHHHHAAPGGGFGVDVVDSHAGPPDHSDLWRRFQQSVVHLHRRANDECVGIGQLRRQSVLDLVVGD